MSDLNGIQVYVTPLLPFERQALDSEGNPTGETELVSCVGLNGALYVSQEAWDAMGKIGKA